MTYRLRIIVLLFLSGLSFVTFAFIPPQSDQLWYNNWYKVYMTYDKCTTDFPGRSSIYHTTRIVSSSFVDGKTTVTVQPVLLKTGEDTSYAYLCIQGGPYTCPANSALVDGGCLCNSGFEENGNACVKIVQEKQCKSGDVGPTGWFDGGSSVDGGPPMAVCIDGCLFMFAGAFPEGSAIVDGKKHYFARGGYVGWDSKCTVGEFQSVPEGMTELPIDTCGTGKVKGEVNGKTVCVDLPSDGGGQSSEVGNSDNQPKTDNKETTETTSSTKTNADGSTTTTTTTTTRHPDGSTTKETKETTTSADGSTTTTKSTTTGSSVDKKAEGDKEAEKCEKNPIAEGCAGEVKDLSGKLYTEKTKTFSSVLSGAKATLESSPIGASVGNFFNVNGGGSCPTISGVIPGFNAMFEFDAFCSPMAGNLFAVLRGVLLFLSAFWAFRIAIE